MLSFLLIKPDRYKIFQFPWDKFVYIFTILAGLSILINKVPGLQGLFGTYDVLKNLLVLYPFAFLRFSKEEFLYILKILIKVALFLAFFGIISEVLAYFFNFGIGYFVSESKRLGMNRMISLTGYGNWNYLGVYLVFFFFLCVVIFEQTRRKVIYLATFILALVLTISRQAWLGFILISVSMKKKYIPIVIIIFLVIASSFLLNLSLYQPHRYYRYFAFEESLKLVGQKPVLGVGPGMFGGLASVLFKSPFYEDWPTYFKQIIYDIHNVDMFWTWILAEFGIVGFLVYMCIFITLFLKIKETIVFFKNNDENLMAKIGKVIQYFILALIAMGFAGGLNSAFVTFTYFAVAGMYLSVYYKMKMEKDGK